MKAGFCYGLGVGLASLSTGRLWLLYLTDFFGPKSIGGLMLTARGVAAVFGPLLIVRIREAAGSYSSALKILAWVMFGSSLLPLLVGGHRAAKATVRAS